MEFKDLATNTLGELAESFDDRKRKTDDGCGWGQFIDGSTSHTQVGPYGTSSGLIAISIARGVDAVVKDAASDLVGQWRRFRKGGGDENKLFCQNPRLAWVYLALSMAAPEFESVADEISQELMNRQLSNGCWGDWWIDDKQHDGTLRRFSTALVYFCLTYRNGSTAEAISWANSRTPIPLASYGYPTIEVIFHTLAVLINADSKKVQSAFRRELKRRSWRQLIDSHELAVYFYDFCFQNGPNSAGYGREYFIVPIRLLGVILGSIDRAPARLKVAALSSAATITEGMHAQHGIYKEAEGARASSLNQAWAAMAISYASKLLAPRFGKVIWWLIKERPNQFVDRYSPFFALSAVTILAAFVPDKPLLKGVVAFCLLLMGWICVPKINKVLR